MVHISELSDRRVPSVEDVVSLGDEITVVVKDIDPSGRIALSRRMLLEGTTPSDSVDNKSSGSSSDSRRDSRGSGRTGGNGGRYNRGSHRS